tara:strand:+ start:2925 stop:3194 length:270 start_codon:yes stop_codon:yes gene_type:complete
MDKNVDIGLHLLINKNKKMSDIYSSENKVEVDKNNITSIRDEVSSIIKDKFNINILEKLQENELVDDLIDKHIDIVCMLINYKLNRKGN